MNKSICVVVTTDFWNDRRVFKQVSSLLKFGYSVTVICSQRPEDSIYESDSNLLIDDNSGNLEVRSVKLTRRDSVNNKLLDKVVNFIWLFSGMMKFVFEINKVKCDLYHLHDIDALFLGGVVAKFKKKKIIFDCHDIFSMIQVKDSVHYKLRSLWGFLERKLPKYSDSVITVASRLKSDLSFRSHVLPENINYIYNTPLLHDLSYSNKIREEHNISSSTCIVLYLGSVNLDRGLGDLINSCMHWNDDIVLAVYGVGHEKAWKKLELLVSELNLTDKVVFGSSVQPSKVKEYLMSSDILTIPNILHSPAYDALPNKFFESIMAGKPFVCNELPEMSSKVRAINCGLVCDRNDPHSYAHAINKLACNPSLRGELGANGRRAAVEAYNWETEEAKLKLIYEGLLE
ncbi:glycosyltransferase family 4 protein [Vibrio profundi]|uniref:glycosyltransferase family 4 protein n=1 Tax=Vibrio profundi TaxID=1774960 RepID=UPI003736D02C